MLLDTTPITFTLYAGEYFNIWKFQVQCIFCSRHLLDIVEGREVFDPGASFATRQFWLQRDQQAMDILVQTMDRKYLPPLLGARSSRQMWIQLLLHYDKHATTSVHGLQKKFFDLKPIPSKGICSFLSEVNNVNDQLRELDLSKAFEEDALINKILQSLPSDFFYFNSAWDSTSKIEKTLLNLSERLIKEEEKLKHAAKNPIDVTQAFYSRPPPKQQLLSNPGNHLYVGKACLHHSHSLLTCPSSPKPPISVNTDGTPLTLEQRQLRQFKHYDDLKKTTTCHACGNTSHWKGECPNLTEAERQSYHKKPHRFLQARLLVPPLARSRHPNFLKQKHQLLLWPVFPMSPPTFGMLTAPPLVTL